jgi:formate dehydrogenase iron-sulfur subunit
MQALLDSVLAEQQRAPSLVEEFAYRHGRNDIAGPRYQKLLPLSAPVRGQQYAFEVHLDKCSGCKACVTACHSLNGLDDEEAWRETGLLVSDDWRNPYQQVVTTACHHCADPGCLNGCPVLAYEKDPFTGIVRHLDDQCIGCQYCILKCPYDVPKYSRARGIVRKCDMCSDRLLAGEAPACVQACPNEAIRITIVEQASLGTEFLPDAPEPSITRPTTRYVSKRPLPASLKASDREMLRPQPAHWPLVLMLVLTQLGTGLFVFAFALEALLPARIVKLQLLAGLLSLCAGLGASILHLGRPSGAWRVFLGVRKSWLSREIVAFGVCLPFAIAYTFSSEARTLLGLGTVIGALAGVFCSAMVYHDTSREYWTLAMTGPKFFGTTFLLGAAGSMLASLGAVGAAPSFLLLLLVAVKVCGSFMKQGAENRAIDALSRDDFSELHKTALLLSERFGLHRRIRVACGIAGGVCFPALLAIHALPAGPGPDSSVRFGLVAAGILFSLAGELIERWLFFVTVQPAKMPG